MYFVRRDGVWDSMCNAKIIRKWKKRMCKMLHTAYPEMSKREIMEYLDGVVEKNLKNPECYIDNNHLNKRMNTTLLEVTEWIYKTEPICAGSGVFFRNQHQITSPLSALILRFLALRKKFKGRLKDFPQDSYEYATFDRKQGSEKQNVNSLYGCFGNIMSFLFNKYTASAVTGSGQSLISTTCMAFEAFMANGVAFNNINECMTYLYNICNEKYKQDLSILPDIDIKTVERRIGSMFYGRRYDGKTRDAVYSYLMMCSQDDLNKIYYKNNIYEFSLLEPIRDVLDNIVTKCDSFVNPNDVPKSIERDLEKLWKYYEEFVFYNYSPIDRIQRLRNDKRRCVVTIDTDSNILNVDPWVKFMFKNVISVNPENAGRDESDLKFITINTMAYIITHMITAVLKKYTRRAYIPDEYSHYINMKNEFLFTRMILASKKKRYMSSVKLREGKVFEPEIIDIKGLDFMKSTTSESVKNKYMDMVTRNVLHSKEINLKGMLQEISKFEGEIIESLQSGEKQYLSPLSVKELEAYSDPFKGQGIRAVHAWNTIYPDMTIELPAKIDIVKVLLDDPDNLAKLANDHPDIYERIDKGIINSKNEKIRKKGFVVLGIPKNVDTIPEWIIPYIDYDTISYNTLKKIFPILESLGFKTLKAGTKEYFSNVINV